MSAPAPLPPRRRSMAATAIVATVALVASTSGCSSGGAGSYQLTASFRRAIGVYPGSPVRVLGMDVGRVVRVRNAQDRVIVTMSVGADRPIAADATASIIPLSLLGERYIEISPAYRSGPRLRDGGRFRRTSVPAEVDELLRGLRDYLGQIKPGNARDVVSRLAEVLGGQGKDLNSLLQHGAGTLALLADKSSALGDIVNSLAELSSTLKGRTATLQSLLDNYALVTQVLTANGGDLDAAIRDLDAATRELASLLVAHRQPLKRDVAELTKVGKTVDRNLDRLGTTMRATVRLFEAAGRAYDPGRNMLNLNNQADPYLTSALIAYRLRDRLAGICRRLGVASCGDPASSFFNGLVGLIPSLLAGQEGRSPAPPAAPTSTPPGGAGGGQPPPPAPAGPAAAPSMNDLLTLVMGRIARQLSPDQVKALQTYSRDLLVALASLSDEQLAALAGFTPDQLARLRGVAPADLARTIDRIRAGTDPSKLLDPLPLPPPPKVTIPFPSTTLPGLGG
ncbi:MAG: MCE family protein [Actinobacteria bacterium]|nr:MCE family protein [Actinomycetota bacterium]